MHLYEISNGVPEVTKWRVRRDDAQSVAKCMPGERTDIRIRLYDYPNDIDTFEGLFNGKRPQGGLLRAWMLTARGGLLEINHDTAVRELQLDSATTE